MSAEILDDTPQTGISIPILHELPDLQLSSGDIIYVWRNYVYCLAPAPIPDTRLIIEADINTRMITRSIPINIIPVDTSMSILTADNPTNIYEPWYIYKCENSICLIEKIIKNPNSHHHTYDVNIYMKNTTTNEEYPHIQLKNIRRICDIIDNSDKLYIAIWDYAELRINVNGEPKPTWFKILVIDTGSNTIIHTIPALNDTIYKLDIIGDKLIACQNWFGPHKAIWDINNLSAAPQIIRQSFISYTRHNNSEDTTLIYPYNGWVGINPNFIESDGYQIVNTYNTPMAELEMVDIINDTYYVGLHEPSYFGSGLNIYNLQTHQLIADKVFIFTSLDIYSKFRPYYISNGHIIFSTPSAIKTYKIEDRPADERKNKYEKIIANLADKYCLARHLVEEINNHFTVELQEFKPCEIIIQT